MEHKDRPIVPADETVKPRPGEIVSIALSELMCNPGKLTLNKMFTVGHWFFTVWLRSVWSTAKFR